MQTAHFGSGLFERRGAIAFIIIPAIVLVNSYVGTVHAATITYVGEVADAGADAPTLYGTDGYDIYGTTPVGTTSGIPGGGGPFSAGTRLTQLPSYISSITAPAGNVAAAGYGYSDIIVPGHGTVEAGVTAALHPAPISQDDLLTLNVSSTPASAFYVGYMTNVDPTLSDYVDDIRLRQTAGSGGGDSGLIPTVPIANGNIDVYFFEVTGALAGDSLTVSGLEDVIRPADNKYIETVSGLLFTSNAVPEPASLSLVALGGIGLLARRRRN